LTPEFLITLKTLVTNATYSGSKSSAPLLSEEKASPRKLTFPLIGAIVLVVENANFCRTGTAENVQKRN
jgi:hypothetical protein